MLTLMIGVFSYNVYTRVPLELTAIRDRNALYLTTDTGAIENIYTLQLANMDQSMHEFELSLFGLPGASLVGETVHTVNAGELRTINIRVRVAPGSLEEASTGFWMTARATDTPDLQATTETRFLKPL